MRGTYEVRTSYHRYVPRTLPLRTVKQHLPTTGAQEPPTGETTLSLNPFLHGPKGIGVLSKDHSTVKPHFPGTEVVLGQGEGGKWDVKRGDTVTQFLCIVAQINDFPKRIEHSVSKWQLSSSLAGNFQRYCL